MSDFRDHANRILNAATAAFGETVRFFPKAGGAYSVQAVFDNAYQAIDPDTQQMVSVNQPTLGINLNNFEVEPRTQDEFEVRGIRFRVTEKKEDGLGGAVLLLNKVRANDRLPDAKTR